MKKYIYLGTAGCLLALVLVFAGIQHKNTIKLKENTFTYELGESISKNPKDYVMGNDRVVKKTVIQIKKKKIENSSDNEEKKIVKEYSGTATYKKSVLKFSIQVLDTTAPNVTVPEKVYVGVGVPVPASSVMTTLSDASNKIAISFKDNEYTGEESVEPGKLQTTCKYEDKAVIYEEKGEYNNTIIVSDASGNVTETNVHFMVIGAPKFSGVKDQTIHVNGKVDYAKGVTVSDELDGDLTDDIVIDSSAVDTSKAGDYKVTYAVTNSIGLTTTKTSIIHVLSDEEKALESNSPSTNASGDWVGNLNIAKNYNQIIVVAASGSSATVSMHSKNGDGTWSQILSTEGHIGRNGIGKTREGDGKTPVGVYGFTRAFGNAPNPGCALGYTQVDDSYYWVDDSNSAYYNQLVSTNEVGCDWSSAEHISAIGRLYNYVLALNYNSACTPGVGSGIFLHCYEASGTAGCISIPDSIMAEIMRTVQPGCVILIDSKSGVLKY